MESRVACCTSVDEISTPLALRLGGDLVADRLFGLRPLAVERGHQVAVRAQRPVRLLPGGAARALDDVGAVVLQAGEKLPPLGIDRGRVALVFGVEVFDVGGVAAVEERGAGEGGIGVLAGHCSILALKRRVAHGNGPRDRHPTADCCFNAIYDACKSTKDLRTESGFQYFYQGLPDSRRRGRYADSSRFHRRDLGSARRPCRRK